MFLDDIKAAINSFKIIGRELNNALSESIFESAILRINVHTPKHLVCHELHRDLVRHFENSKVLPENIDKATIEMKANKLIILAEYYSFNYNIDKHNVNDSYFSASYLSFKISSP